MENIKTIIRFSLFFFFSFLLCGCLICRPVSIHAKIKNNTSETVIIDNSLKAGILALPKGECKEIECWGPLKIIFPDDFSRMIDCHDISDKDGFYKKNKDSFTKAIATYSFELSDEGILCLAKDGGYITYKEFNQPILYDEISIVRIKSENAFVRIKIKNNSPLPVKLTSLDAFGYGRLPIQIKKKKLFPITLPPSEEYILQIPCNIFIDEVSKIEIKTDCPQQPRFECYIYLSNELTILKRLTE